MENFCLTAPYGELDRKFTGIHSPLQKLGRKVSVNLIYLFISGCNIHLGLTHSLVHNQGHRQIG